MTATIDKVATSRRFKRLPEPLPINVEPLHGAYREKYHRQSLQEALETVVLDWPVPAIDRAYEEGDDEVDEPVFAEDFDEVLRAAVAEVTDEVGDIIEAAINRRLPWSTTLVGYRTVE